MSNMYQPLTSFSIIAPFNGTTSRFCFLLYQKIYLIEAIHIIPTITVTDKFFVHKAMISVGIIAKKILQLIDSKDPSSIMKLLMIRAVKIQIGINESHLVTISGIFIFLTTINGIILGIKVKITHPNIIRKMDKFILIYLLTLQSLQQ